MIKNCFALFRRIGTTYYKRLWQTYLAKEGGGGNPPGTQNDTI